jgi:hypothetical protein
MANFPGLWKPPGLWHFVVTALANECNPFKVFSSTEQPDSHCLNMVYHICQDHSSWAQELFTAQEVISYVVRYLVLRTSLYGKLSNYYSHFYRWKYLSFRQIKQFAQERACEKQKQDLNPDCLVLGPIFCTSHVFSKFIKSSSPRIAWGLNKNYDNLNILFLAHQTARMWNG